MTHSNTIDHVSRERLQRIKNDARGMLLSPSIFEDYEARKAIREVEHEEQRRMA